MRMKLLSALAAAAALSSPMMAHADAYTLWGDVTVVSPGQGSDPHAFQMTSAGAGYASIQDKVTSGLTVSGLTTLSADYETSDAFIGGSPRFSLSDSSGHEAYVYWGTPLGGGSFSNPTSGAWASTGNLAGATDLRVYVNGFGGISQPNTGVTWQQFVNEAGSTSIDSIYLDVDGGWASPQQVLVDNFAVNGSVLDAVPEPATWALMLLGLGVIGGAMRSSRRRTGAVAAA